MTTTEAFGLTDAPPEHKLTYGLIVRDQGLRVVDFTIVFDAESGSEVTIPCDVRVLGGSGPCQWIVGGFCRPDTVQDSEERSFLMSTLNWLTGDRAMPHYRVSVNSRTRKGQFALSDEPLLPSTLW